MERPGYSDGVEESYAAFSVGTLRALGRGFLIAAAGLLAGAVLGTFSLAPVAGWCSVAGAALLGGVCLSISSHFRARDEERRACDPHDTEDECVSRFVAMERALANVPELEMTCSLPDGRYVSRLIREREEPASRKTSLGVEPRR